MLDDGEKLVPGFRQARALRVWAGVRPLFEDAKADDTADPRRDPRARAARPPRARRRRRLRHDHRRQAHDLPADGGADGRRGLPACSARSRPCTTATQPLPGSEGGEHYQLGERLARKEARLTTSRSSASASWCRARSSSRRSPRTGTTNLDDIRRQLRLGMGPCQGGFCIYRATGIMHGVDGLTRRAGRRGAAGFPAGALEGRLADPVRRPAPPDAARRLDLPRRARRGAPAGVRTAERLRYDAVVIGAGTAGLAAGIRLAQAGASVCVLAKGVGSTHLAPGDDRRARATRRSSSTRRARAWPALLVGDPDHPYGLIGADARRGRDRLVHRSRSGRAAARATATSASLERNSCCRPRSARCEPRRWCRRRWRPAMRGELRPRLHRRHSAAARLPPSLCAANLAAAGIHGARGQLDARARARRHEHARARPPVRRRRLARRGSAHGSRRCCDRRGARRPAGDARPARPARGACDLEAAAGPTRCSRSRRCRRRSPACGCTRSCARALRDAGGRLVLGCRGGRRERDGRPRQRPCTTARRPRRTYAADWFVLASGGFALRRDRARLALVDARAACSACRSPACRPRVSRASSPTTSTSSRSPRRASRSTPICRADGRRQRARRRRGAPRCCVPWREGSGEGLALGSGYRAARRDHRTSQSSTAGGRGMSDLAELSRPARHPRPLRQVHDL